MRKVKRTYRIPLIKRFVELDNSLRARCKLFEVDGVGLFVYYRKEESVNHQNIRKHLIGVEETYAIVEANSLSEAISKVQNDWEGMNIGLKHKALSIKFEGEFSEYPMCPRMYYGKADKFSGEGFYCFAYPKDESPAGCILDTYDPPEDCPLCKGEEKVIKVRVILGKEEK